MEPALRLETRLAISPALLAFTEMLALPAADLDGLVARELSANPALERADVPACPFCGSVTRGYCCPPGIVPARIAAAPEAGDQTGAERWGATRTGAEELLAEVRWCASEDIAALAAYVVGSLDDHGYLPDGPEQVAADLAVPVATVRKALRVLRQVGPVAIAARDARESLLLQLAARPPAEPLRALAAAVVDRYLEPLSRGRLDVIAASLGTGPGEIAAAGAYIRRHCVPFPAPGLRGAPPAAGAPAVPDVVITTADGDDGRLRAEVIEPARLALRISPGYERLAARHRGQEAGQHAAGLVQRAAWFITRLEERHRTVRRVAEHAANRQRDFVLRGPRYLKPLAQAEVARDLGVHESTVSRAVAGKHMMLPSRGVVPVQDFFRAALAPQDALGRIVSEEERPLTDSELARLLQAQGFRVARRTVAKYRRVLGIPAAPERGAGLAAK